MLKLKDKRKIKKLIKLTDKRIAKKGKCPECKKDLQKVGVGYGQGGTMYYDYVKGGNYEQDEFDSQEGGEFYCKNCGYYLNITDSDEMDKLL